MKKNKIAEKFFDFVERELKISGYRGGAWEFAKNSLGISAVIGIFCWLAIGLVLKEIVFSFFFGVACAVIVFFLLLFLVKLKNSRSAAGMESELPLVLLSIAAELNMSISFEKALENASKSGSGRLSREFERIAREHKQFGTGLQELLSGFAGRTGSLAVKRSIAQLCNVLEQGKKHESGESVKRIALELLDRQKAELKYYNGKLVVFSLMFIAVSAIVPAIFQSLVIVGSMILKVDFSPLQVFLVIAVAFPLADLAVLLYIRNSSPVFLGD